MATQANVSLRFVMSGAQSVVAVMDRLSGKKKDLERPLEIPVRADDRDAQTKLKRLRTEMAEVNRMSAEAKIKLRDDAARARMAAFKLELKKVNDYVARPTISDRGMDRTLLRIARLRADLERLDRTNVGPKFNAFTGISGVGSGASAAVIQGLTSPAGAAAAAAAIPFAGTAIGGGVLGALGTGIAGLGIAGALGAGQGKTTPAMMAQAQGGLQAALLRQKAAQEALNKLQDSGKASAGQLASAQARLAGASTAVSTAQAKIVQLRRDGMKADNSAVTALNNLKNKAQDSLRQIGAPIVPVMAKILNTVSGTMDKLTPVFVKAEAKIAPALQGFGTTLANSLASPAVTRSIGLVAKSFSDFLKVFTPQIPGIVNSLANGISGIATAFEDHPGMIQGMANVIDFLLKLPGYTLSAIGALVRVTSWMTSGFPHEVSRGLDEVRIYFTQFGHTVEAIWNRTWTAVANELKPVWADLGGIVRIGWALIVGIFKASIGVIVASWRIFWSVISNVAKVVWTVVKNTIKGIWDIIVGLFKFFVAVLTGNWQAGLNAMKNMGTQIWNLTKSNLSSIWNAIKNIGIAIWNALKAYLIGLWNTTKTSAITIWNNVKAALVNTWNSVVSTGKNIWSGFFQWLHNAWSAAVSVAKAVWAGIEGAVLTPVRWVVNNVWDPFANIIDKATSFLHLGTPLPVVRMAGGGVVPQLVSGSGDRQPALLEAGETVVDKRTSARFSHLFSMMGVPGYAAGGRIGGQPSVGAAQARVGPGAIITGGNPLADLAHSAVNIGKKLIQGAILDVVKPAVNAILGLLSHMPGAGSGFGKMVMQFPKTLANDFFSWIAGKDKAANAMAAHVPNVGSGVARWGGLVSQALSMLGLPGSLARQVLYQMQTESGGNPNAQNNWDINAAHGDPSRGLLQVIMSTFRAYHVPGTSNNIFDPLANIAAAINYARHVYGPSLMRGGMGMGSGHGYADGTDGADPGWAWVGEEGPEMVYFFGGEEVVPHGQGGYAKGTRRRRRRTPRRAAHHGIPAGEISTGISLDLAFMHGDLMSLAKLHSEQITYLKAISRYYSGSGVAWRDAMVNRQVKAMEAAAARLASIKANYDAAKGYASSVTGNAMNFGALSGIDITNTGNAGQALVQGLGDKLDRIRQFGRAINGLKRKGVSNAVLRQIIDMGPDQGFAYADALNNATPDDIHNVNLNYSLIGRAANSLGRGAAMAVYGVDIAKGLAQQERPLIALMRRLGRELGREAISWFHVPRGKVPRGYATGTMNAARGWAMVGEHGPELMLFHGGEKVIPGGTMMGAGGGGLYIGHLTINVGGTAVHTKAEIGREVVSAIGEFERRSGKGWRSR